MLRIRKQLCLSTKSCAYQNESMYLPYVSPCPPSLNYKFINIAQQCYVISKE